MLTKIQIQNFKAIHRLASIPLQQFTALIGNNGSGKSTVIEALQFLQECIELGLDGAAQHIGGIAALRNYQAPLPEPVITARGFQKRFEPIVIGITLTTQQFASARILNIRHEVHLNQNAQDEWIVEFEKLDVDGKMWYVAHVQTDGVRVAVTQYEPDAPNFKEEYGPANRLVFTQMLRYNTIAPAPLTSLMMVIQRWQFLQLNPLDMGKPVPKASSKGDPRLSPDGRNIAEYLLWLRSQGQEHLDRLIDLMKFVLPYVSDVQPSVTQGFNREVELAMLESAEQAKPLPGWLLSGGTLRVLAILSQFVLPKKPPVLFIDEIENGLDPHTIGLILSLIQQEYHSKGMQVIVTSHSPYFLDLCELQNIVVCEKDATGCHFSIPDDDAKLKVWKEKFSPGQLYTMGKLTK